MLEAGKTYKKGSQKVKVLFSGTRAAFVTTLQSQYYTEGTEYSILKDYHHQWVEYREPVIFEESFSILQGVGWDGKGTFDVCRGDTISAHFAGTLKLKSVDGVITAEVDQSNV